MSTTTAPTVARWQEANRYALRRATTATRSQRERCGAPASSVVLGYVVARTPAARVTVDDIADATGLTREEVTDAIADLEDEGRLENGALSTGRLGILVAAVLNALGLQGWGLPLELVRADVPPAGTHVEITDVEMTEAMA